MTDQDGNNLLHLAIMNNESTEVIKFLIEVAKININSKNSNGYTPFLLAAKKGNLEVLQLLKEKGSKIYICNKKGNSALHLAIINQQPIESSTLLRKLYSI